jgi:hypothetical protein
MAPTTDPMTSPPEGPRTPTYELRLDVSCFVQIHTESAVEFCPEASILGMQCAELGLIAWNPHTC